MGTRICTKCGKEYPVDDFPFRYTSIGERRKDCKFCINAYHRMRYLEKLGRFKRDVRRDIREVDPKKCLRCKEIKPLSEFAFHNRTKGQHNNFCHECEKAWWREYHQSPEGKEKSKEWIEKNRDRIAAYKEIYKNDPERKVKSKIYHRKHLLMKDYGMTIEEYNSILFKQKGCCAICESGQPDVQGRKNSFHVDHDHKTGKVRGLLCHNCNVTIGLMKDSPLLLHKAATYLELF